MELHEIRYFLALANTLNFTRAARACNVSQPALTRAIQKLESELGGLLFSRERNNTHLTELGRLVQPHLTEVYSRTEAAKQHASRFLRLENAHLSLGVMCTIAPTQFIGFLAQFRFDHPGIEMTILEDVPDRLSELLLGGELDIGVMASPEGFEPPLQASELYTERFVVACGPGHRLVGNREIAMAELHEEFYLSRINCEYYDVLAALARDQQVNLIDSYRSEREDWVLTMVAAGLGICFLPEFSADFPGVVGRPLREPEIARNVCLVTVAGRRWSPPVKAFVEAARRHHWRSSLERDAAETKQTSPDYSEA